MYNIIRGDGMEEQILDILKQDNRAFTVYELNDALRLKTV